MKMVDNFTRQNLSGLTNLCFSQSNSLYMAKNHELLKTGLNNVVLSISFNVFNNIVHVGLDLPDLRQPIIGIRTP